MTSTQDVETPVITNSPRQDSFHPDDQIPSWYVTPGYKPFFSSNLTLFYFEMEIDIKQHEKSEWIFRAISDLVLRKL